MTKTLARMRGHPPHAPPSIGGSYDSCRHGGRVAWLDAHIDHGNASGIDCRNGRLEGGDQGFQGAGWAETS